MKPLVRGIIFILLGWINLVGVSSNSPRRYSRSEGETGEKLEIVRFGSNVFHIRTSKGDLESHRSTQEQEGSGKSGKSWKILDTSKYLTLEEQYKYLKSIAQRSESAKLEVVGNTKIKGKSFSNDIYSITIGDDNDPVLFFDCGIHAREWISPATCNYLIQKLAHVFDAFKHYKGRINPKKAAVFNFQWVFLPNMNPDGYEKTHSGDPAQGRTHRMHRKNRRPLSAMELSEEFETKCDDEGNCEGIDLNRNFPGGWGIGSDVFLSSSKKPWNSDYKGPNALSEPESKVLDSLVTKLLDRILLAVSIHSYGKDIYYPKGYLPNDHPDQIQGKAKEFLRDFANYFNKALHFRLGSVSELLEPAEMCGGATDDYYYSTQNINLTYTIELDPHIDDHHVGFELPPDRIEKVGKKMWKALKLMARKLTKLYPQYEKNH